MGHQPGAPCGQAVGQDQPVRGRARPPSLPRPPPAVADPKVPRGLELAIIAKAVDLLSGPGGLASFLRRRQLGARLAGPSLPLDIGYSVGPTIKLRSIAGDGPWFCQPSQLNGITSGG